MDEEWERVGPWLVGQRNGWTFRLMVGVGEGLSGLVDVHAFSPSGIHMVGTVGTTAAIADVLSSYRQTGECHAGLYFWCSGLVIVAAMNAETVLSALGDLAEREELASVFETAASNH